MGKCLCRRDRSGRPPQGKEPLPAEVQQPGCSLRDSGWCSLSGGASPTRLQTSRILAQGFNPPSEQHVHAAAEQLLPADLGPGPPHQSHRCGRLPAGPSMGSACLPKANQGKLRNPEMWDISAGSRATCRLWCQPHRHHFLAGGKAFKLSVPSFPASELHYAGWMRQMILVRSACPAMWFSP